MPSEDSLAETVKREVRLALVETTAAQLRADFERGKKEGMEAHHEIETRFSQAQERLSDRMEWLTRYLLGTATAVVLNLILTIGAMALAIYERTAH